MVEKYEDLIIDIMARYDEVGRDWLESFQQLASWQG